MLFVTFPVLGPIVKNNFLSFQLKFSPHSPLPSSLVITTEDMSRNTSELKVDLRSRRVRFLEKSWLQQPDVYWMLPEKFLGNKVLG